MDTDSKKEESASRPVRIEPPAQQKGPQETHPFQKTDDDYWEEMLGLSKGPRFWNFSCG